jgi:serine/threonine-protein kinase
MDRVEAAVIPGTDGASTPFFSPDGQWIAFWTDESLKKVPISGGLPVKLADYRDPVGPYPHMGGSWGADGTIIVGTHLGGLQRVSADGGRLVDLTVPDPATEYAHRLPQILPGGRAILFTVAYSYMGAGGQIEVLSLDTGIRKTVVDSGLDGRYVPTGHLLYFHQGTLMAAPFDLDQLELTGRAVPVLDGVTHATNLARGWSNSGAGLLTVSNSGTLVFAAGTIASDEKRQFIWVDRAGDRRPVPGLPEGWIDYPRISPDGRWLAFTTMGLNRDLWVHDLVRGTNKKLSDKGRLIHFAWAPDGDRVAVGLSQGGIANLFLLCPQSTDSLERLTSSNYLHQPGSWSPDGRFLAYLHWQPFEGPSIWLLDMASRETVPFLSGDHPLYFPEFSPDGRWLSYSTRDELGRFDVWVTSFPGRERQMLVSNDGGNAPLWAPDGREIFYRTQNELMAVEVEAGSEMTLGRPRALFENPSEEGGPVRMYDITPDGEKFIFSIAADSEPPVPPVRQLHVVLNWFEELNRLVPTE